MSNYDSLPVEQLCDSENAKIEIEQSGDPFYSKSNIGYLERIARDIEAGEAHFAEHDLIEE